MIYSLGPHEVHVWIVDLPAEADEIEPALKCLSSEEKLRFLRLRTPQKRVQFAVSRACLRTILQEYTNQTPETIRFGYGRHGKPFLLDAACEFNLSHSDNLAAVALSRRRRVGIDVESIAAHPEWPLAQLEDWTRKESCFKGRGTALSLGNYDFRRGWTVHKLWTVQGYTGFLSIEQGPCEIRQIFTSSSDLLQPYSRNASTLELGLTSDL